MPQDHPKLANRLTTSSTMTAPPNKSLPASRSLPFSPTTTSLTISPSSPITNLPVRPSAHSMVSCLASASAGLISTSLCSLSSPSSPPFFFPVSPAAFRKSAMTPSR